MSKSEGGYHEQYDYEPEIPTADCPCSSADARQCAVDYWQRKDVGPCECPCHVDAGLARREEP